MLVTRQKPNVVAFRRAVAASQTVFPTERLIISVLKNPKNVIGDGVLTTLPLHSLDASADYAFYDLTLLLFKLAIEGQRAPIAELIQDPKFIDPYTGSYPYLEESKVCYPAWSELVNRKSSPQCIQLPSLRTVVISDEK